MPKIPRVQDIIEDRNRKIIKRVSKQVRKLDKKLGTNIFPKNLR